MDKYLIDQLRLWGAFTDSPQLGPKNLTIHLTNLCNLDCVYCWYHDPSNNYQKKGFLEYEKVIEIIRDCKKLHVDKICLSGTGEPTLHPHIDEIVKMIKKNNMFLTVLSNGTWKTSFFKVIHFVDQLKINLPAPNRILYKEICSKDKFETVIKNMLLLSKLKMKKDMMRPIIEGIFLVNKLNYKELPHMIKIYKKADVDCIRLKKMAMTKDNGEYALSRVELREFKEIAKKVDIANLKDDLSTKNSFEEIQERAKSNENDTAKKGISCCLSYYSARVNYYGDVTLCCMDGRFRHGNIYKNSFFEIWNSKKAQNFRINAKYNLNVNKSEWRECRNCYQKADVAMLQSKIEKLNEKIKDV